MKEFLKNHPRWVAGFAALVLGLALYGINPDASNQLFSAVVEALTGAVSQGDPQ